MITLVLYQNVTKNSSAAEKVANYCLIKLLHEKKVLDKVICKRHTLTDEFDGLSIISIAQSPIYFLVNKMFRLLKRLGINLSDRYFLEMIFDRLTWHHNNKRTTKLIYANKPALPYTFKKSNYHQIKAILRTSIAHPFYNYYLVRNEEQKLGLKRRGSYSNIRRANRVARCCHWANLILVNNVTSKEEFLLSTYLPCFEPAKLIRYRQMFVQPSEPTGDLVELNDDKVRFIHVANMNLIKGTHCLLRAWKTFQKLYPNQAELFLIGAVDTNLKKTLSIENLDQTSTIKFLGFQRMPFIKYRNASAFILSSLSEGGPATLIEALGVGIPVITSENCGLSKLIENGFNGFTYQFNDIGKLEDLLKWFMENQERLPKLRQNAKETAKTFSCKHYQDEVWPILKGQL